MPQIPIILTPNPAPVSVTAANLNELITLVARYLSGRIDVANVSFFISGTVDPASDQGLFFNTVAKVFKVWNSTLGKYIPLSELQVGDVKTTFVSGDDAAAGWIQLDGRSVNLVTGITTPQKTNLETLFGVNGTLPNLTPLGTIGTIPSGADITNIPIAEFTPTNGAIEALPIAALYNQLEVQALRDQTEIVRDSAAADNQALTTLRDKTAQIATALTGTTTGTFAKVFIGFP